MAKNPNVNKYNVGLKSVRTLKPDADAPCLPNGKYDYLEMSKRRRAQLDSQIRRFGFTDRETWSLEYTSCVWLYSHIKMMLDIGGKVVDYEWDGSQAWSDELFKELEEAGVDTKKYHNDKAVFEYICQLLEEADELSCGSYSIDNDKKAMELQSKAFRIYSVIMHAAWW